MTWRHNSAQEKTLYKVVLALALLLAIFIIVVAVIDVQYRRHINLKEDEMNSMENQISSLQDSVETLKSATVNMATLYTTLAEMTNSSLAKHPQIYNPPPPPPPPHDPTNDTSSNDTKTTELEPVETPESSSKESVLVDALRHLLGNFYKIIDSSKHSVSKSSRDENGKIKERGTFIFIADITNEKTPLIPNLSNNNITDTIEENPDQMEEIEDDELTTTEPVTVTSQPEIQIVNDTFSPAKNDSTSHS